MFKVSQSGVNMGGTPPSSYPNFVDSPPIKWAAPFPTGQLPYIYFTLLPTPPEWTPLGIQGLELSHGSTTMVIIL